MNWAVPVETEGTFRQQGPPQRMFSMDPYYVGSFFNWDVSPDGQQFLMIKPVTSSEAGAADQQFTVVLDWFNDLRQVVPTE